jgi:GT2 family glycosyltransferase
MPPKVTLIVTQRERMSLSEMSLESILSDQSEPFRLIYVDGGSPEPVRAYLKRRVPEVGGLLIRKEEWLWPNVARNSALPHVDTPYVVFIDNDVAVEQGWMRKLVVAAEETGAAIVGPLYLISDGIKEPVIHMAGGTTVLNESPAGVALHERHERLNAPLAERAELTRQACDFVEYHCTLARTDFVRNAGGLSNDIVCVHEHIDIALDAKKAGLPVIFEPAAAVTQHAFAPFRLADLTYHRWRWHRDSARTSLSAFARKWNVLDDTEATKGVRDFIDGMTSHLDPLVPTLEHKRARAPLKADDVKQTLYGFLSQALAQGYSRASLDTFIKANNVALTLFGGGFRPCTRSFVAHCVGTASALAAVGFTPRIVVAGLLHAAYSHAPLGPQPHAALADICVSLGKAFGQRVEQSIRRYARFQLNPNAWREAHPVETMTVEDAETVAIALANEIDLWTSGEALLTNDRGNTTDEWISYFRAVARGLAVEPFAETLVEQMQAKPPEGFTYRTPHRQSFRLVRSGVAPMISMAFGAWDAHDAPFRQTA